MSRTGFIKDKLDIKILILYVMQRIMTPVNYDQLLQLVMIDEGLDYFLYAECVSELVETEHLSLSEDEMYSITEKGRTNGSICESGIAFSVRKRAEERIAELKPEFMRNALISTSISDREDGCCTVCLKFGDECGEIMNLEVLAGNQSQALKIARNFRRSAERIYNAVMQDLAEKY